MTPATRGSRSSCITLVWTWRWRRARPITAWYGAVMVHASLAAWHVRTTLASKGKRQKPQGIRLCACYPQASPRGKWSSSPTANFSCVFVSPSSFRCTRRVCARRKSQAEVIPVTLRAQLSEIGTLELWCREATGDRQWRLQFDVRAAAGPRVAETSRAAGVAPVEDVLDTLTLDACDRLIHETFTSMKPGAEPEGLMRRLEQVTKMPRTAWPSSVLRYFWEVQMAVMA